MLIGDYKTTGKSLSVGWDSTVQSSRLYM